MAARAARVSIDNCVGIRVVNPTTNCTSSATITSVETMQSPTNMQRITPERGTNGDPRTDHPHQAHYASFRNGIFPSYERVRFVRIPEEWLPPSVHVNGGSQELQELPTLNWWPAFIYRNIPELVRDLPSAEGPQLKAKLILEHRRQRQKQLEAGHDGDRPVARLLGWKNWKDVLLHGNPNDANVHQDANSFLNDGSSGSDSNNPFAYGSLQLLNLKGNSIEDSERRYGSSVSFYDLIFDLEEKCKSAINACRNYCQQVEGSKNQDWDENENVMACLHHALQFRKGLDCAINCLAMDTGDPLLPVRWDGEEMQNLFSILGGSNKAKSRQSSKPKISKTISHIENANDIVSRKGPASEGRNGGDLHHNKENNANVQAGRSSTGGKSKSFKDTRTPNKSSTKKVAKSTASQPTSNTTPDKIASSSMTAPPVKGAPFPSSITWSQLWRHMLRSGWKWLPGSGLTSYYYIKPGRFFKGGTEGVDYFSSEAEVERYARDHYCERDLDEGLDDYDEDTQKEEETVANNSCDDVPPIEGEPIEPDEPWGNVWSKLQRSGWNWRAGSGLMDYNYVKPGRRVKGGVSGQDFFEGEKELKKYVQENYGWRGENCIKGDLIDDKVQKNEERLSSKKRFQSPSSKNQEVETHCDDDVPTIVGEPIQPYEYWGNVWQKLLKSGWDWRAGSGLMDYYYVKPGCRVKGGVSGRDFFEGEKELKKYVKKNYGWKGEKRSEGNVDEIRTDKIKKNNKRSLSPPSKDQESDTQCDDFVPMVMGEPIQPHEPWCSVWQKLRKSGWNWKTGSGLMMDYYYVKPGRKVKGGVLGQDFFAGEEELKKFAKRNYGWKDEDVSEVDCDTSFQERGSKKRQKLSIESTSSSGSRRSGKLDAKNNDKKSLDTSNSKQSTKRNQESPYTWKSSSPHSLSKKRSSDENAPPIQGESILSHEPWQSVWEKMLQSGWSWGKGGGLVDYYYYAPGVTKQTGSVKGKDYFISLDDVKSFAERNYGWKGEQRRRSKDHEDEYSTCSSKKPCTVTSNMSTMSTPQDCKTKPQDPAIPLFTPSSTSSPKEDPYEWVSLWPRLQQAGWSVIKAGRFNMLHDWYYIRPNRHPKDKSTKLGVDYFVCPEDVIAFVKQWDEKGSDKDVCEKGKGISSMFELSQEY